MERDRDSEMRLLLNPKFVKLKVREMLRNVSRLLPEMVAEISDPAGEELLRNGGFRMTQPACEPFTILFLWATRF